MQTTVTELEVTEANQGDAWNAEFFAALTEEIDSLKEDARVLLQKRRTLIRARKALLEQRQRRATPPEDAAHGDDRK